MSDIPPNEKALPEIKIEEFRARYPQLFSDPRVDEIYCDPGWGGLLLVLCDTLQSHLTRHPDVTPVTVAQSAGLLAGLWKSSGLARCV